MIIGVQLSQIANASQALAELMAIKLPAKAAYSVAKLARACEAEMKDLGAQRDKIFTEAGCTVNEESKQYVHADPEALKAAAQAAAELMDLTVDLNAHALDLSHFGNAEISAGILFALDWAIKAGAE